MATGANATIRLKFTSQKQLSALLSALSPEAKKPVSSRADVKLEKNGLFLVLNIVAEDTVALRATLNAYLWWINSTISVINTVAEQA
jgi:tRNA threonylcarbamoyladenosine modification (KEOPS) complex  Pcc1 subunit